MSQETTHSLVTALRAVPDFASIDDHTLLRIVGASANLLYAKGERIFERGDPSEALYVLLSGTVHVFDEGDDGEDVIDEIEAGRSFGEFSLLLETTHSKSAEVVEDAEILVLPAGSFRRLLDDSPDLAEYFRRRIQEQKRIRGEVSEPA